MVWIFREGESHEAHEWFLTGGSIRLPAAIRTPARGPGNFPLRTKIHVRMRVQSSIPAQKKRIPYQKRNCRRLGGIGAAFMLDGKGLIYGYRDAGRRSTLNSPRGGPPHDSGCTANCRCPRFTVASAALITIKPVWLCRTGRRTRFASWGNPPVWCRRSFRRHRTLGPSRRLPIQCSADRRNRCR